MDALIKSLYHHKQYFSAILLYSVFTVLLESAEHGSQSVLVLQISGTLTQFILSIFSIEFMSPPVLQLLCQHNVGGSRSSGIRQDEFARWGLQLQPQMSHVDAAPMLLLPLWICERLGTSQLIKMKWWKPFWYLFVLCRISDWSHMT